VWAEWSHHAKLSNPRVGAVRGLLKKTCWASAHVCTCVYVLNAEVPFTRRSGAGGGKGEGGVENWLKKSSDPVTRCPGASGLE